MDVVDDGYEMLWLPPKAHAASDSVQLSDPPNVVPLRCLSQRVLAIELT